ncbi:MAG: hypothetical protein JWN45_2544 [Acidobacteriaceae bacterium]|jgi:hypothetical protein|nr:hypothetical protein [Acidobacteriaceae bacterium]
MSTSQPVDVYELRAAEQRRQLHGSVVDLKDAIRQKLDVKANAREYMVPAAGVLALFGLALGFSLAGVFYVGSRDRRERRAYPDWLGAE